MSSVIPLELTGTGGSSSSSATACCLCNFSLLPEGSGSLVTLSLASLVTTDGDVGTSLVSVITLSTVSLAMPNTFSLVVLDGIIPMGTSDVDDEATPLGVVVVKVTSDGKVASLPV